MTLRIRASVLSLLSAILLLGAWRSAAAADLQEIPLTYPGLIVQEDARALFHVEAYIVKLGVQVYHATYGEWPATWSEVVEAGIATAPLLTPFGDVINPDDRHFDFDYDLHYDYHNGSPRTALFVAGSNPSITYQPIESVPALLPANLHSKRPELAAKVASPARQRQLAVNRMLTAMLSLYSVLHRKAPASWAEFEASGFCPLAPGTLNPLTAEQYRFDGSPDNFEFVYLPELGEHGGYSFKPLDENGAPFWPYSA